jgi:flagellar hook-length control protein FliK
VPSADASSDGGGASSGDGSTSDPDPSAVSAPAAQASQATDPAAAAAFAVAAPAAAIVPDQAPAVTPQTVTKLAAGIVQNIKAKSTRFQLALDPAGLGRVDISVQIGPDGQITAALNFNSPQAADALKAHAAELRDALQQAGFSLSGSDLSFTAGGSNQQSAQGQGQGQGQSQSTPSYATAAATAAAEPQPQTPAYAASSTSDGLDIRI